MKSLEILSWFIDALGGFSDGRILVEKKELETIKQDLEVLEILRKHLEIVEYLGRKDIETSGLNTIKNIKDFNKVKQWLEVNE